MNNKLKKIRKLNQQAWALIKKDGPTALELARQAQGLLSNCAQAEPLDEFECLKTQTYCLDMLSKPEEALTIGLKAKQLAEQIGDKNLIASMQNLLGRIYWHIDDYPTSLEYYTNGLILVQAESDPKLEISLINGLGLVQYGLENYVESLGYFKTCLEKAAEDDPDNRGDANNNIAYVLHILGRDQEAAQYAAAALDLFIQTGNYVGKLHTLHSLGAIHLTLKNYDQAMTFLQDGLALARINNSDLLELTYTLEISRIHQAWGNFDQAEKELLKALQDAEKLNSLTNISLIHERLIEIYKGKQDYKSALEHFEAFHAAHIKIFNDKSDRRIKTLEVLHQVESTRKQADLYRELAGTDSLTGLVNRRHFLEMAEIVLKKATIDLVPLAIIMLDIDHFKKVNDQFGHKAGDEALSVVASSIKKSLRGSDFAGRYGGEEFVVLLVGAPMEQCVNIAERIRGAVAQLKIQIDSEIIKVTISLGLVCRDPDRELPLDGLLNCADQALYIAKRQGRNRVVAWRQDSESM